MGILARLSGALLGLALAVGSGYGAWSIIQMVITGAASGNLVMVLAGGILACIFAGLCIVGVIVGGVIIIFSLFGD